MEVQHEVLLIRQREEQSPRPKQSLQLSIPPRNPKSLQIRGRLFQFPKGVVASYSITPQDWFPDRYNRLTGPQAQTQRNGTQSIVRRSPNLKPCAFLQQSDHHPGVLAPCMDLTLETRGKDDGYRRIGTLRLRGGG